MRENRTSGLMWRMLETGQMTRLRGTLARKGRNGLASQGLYYYHASIRPYHIMAVRCLQIMQITKVKASYHAEYLLNDTFNSKV